MTPEAHDAGRGIRDQITRYSGAFAAVIGMVVLAALIGGYILSQERLSLPGWVPIVGRSNFMLKAEFREGDALTPGQGQAVTIAGAKVGEIGGVELHDGVAVVTMDVTPKYARYIYRDSTLLMRPRTQLKDETIQITPGLPTTGRVHSGYTFSLSQTAPDGNFDQFLAALDTETRTYLQELLVNAGVALQGNGRALSADFTRFDPIARRLQEINSELHLRHVNIERAIHNFQLLLNAIGGKDKQLTEVIEAANRVFAVFSRQQTAVEGTLRALPGTLQQTDHGLSALARAADVMGPTLSKLHTFAKSYGPSQEALRTLAKETTPVIKNEIGPFTREVLPVLQQVTPATKAFNKSLPKLASSFQVINELFNELGYNPGPNQAGFLFFLDWANHDFNSALSTSDANGPMGRTLLYYNCLLTAAIEGAAKINPTVKVVYNLLKPPSETQCEAEIKEKVQGVTASVRQGQSGSHASAAEAARTKRGGH